MPPNIVQKKSPARPFLGLKAGLATVYPVLQMSFDSSQSSARPGETLFEDRFRHVESAIVFRKVVCHRCDFGAIYKYRVQQVRRKEEIEVGPDEEVRPDHLQIWNSIPRFAEIPETVKCKRCGEVLGLCTECIF